MGDDPSLSVARPFFLIHTPALNFRLCFVRFAVLATSNSTLPRAYLSPEGSGTHSVGLNKELLCSSIWPQNRTKWDTDPTLAASWSRADAFRLH
jgi:hypothetical protein